MSYISKSQELNNGVLKFQNKEIKENQLIKILKTEKDTYQFIATGSNRMIAYPANVSELADKTYQILDIKKKKDKFEIKLKQISDDKINNVVSTIEGIWITDVLNAYSSKEISID